MNYHFFIIVTVTFNDIVCLCNEFLHVKSIALAGVAQVLEIFHLLLRNRTNKQTSGLAGISLAFEGTVRMPRYHDVWVSG